jgi:FkbM family methyltransferase
VGDLTVIFTHLVGPTGRVHAFEPTRAAERLSAAAAALGRENLVLNHQAVAETEGARVVYEYEGDFLSWSGFAQRPLERYGIEAPAPTAIEVQAVTLDGYCSAAGVDRIDLLKIDVEGAEFEVLKGARQLLSERRVERCVFEWGQTSLEIGVSGDDFRSFLGEVGYGVRNLIRGAAAFSVRGGLADFAMHVARPRRS